MTRWGYEVVYRWWGSWGFCTFVAYTADTMTDAYRWQRKAEQGMTFKTRYDDHGRYEVHRIQYDDDRRIAYRIDAKSTVLPIP